MKISVNKKGVIEIDMEGALIVDGESKGKYLVDIDADNVHLKNFDLYSYRKNVGAIKVSKNAMVEKVSTYTNLKPKIYF